MNIIKLNERQVRQIFNAMEAECGTDDNIMIPTHFPFNEFTIDIQGGLPIKVKLYEGYGLNKFDFEMQCVLSTGNIGIFEVKCDRYNIKYPKVNGISREAIRDAAESFRDAIWEITAFIMTYQRDRKEKHSVPRKYSREHRISTSQNKIYLLDDIVKYVHDNYVPQGGTHNIQCECWGVRGHYRTYKSGKKIWINAFKKGKKRNETEPKDKTYYLSKGEIV